MALPVKEAFEPALAEQQQLLALLDPCLKLDPACFGEAEFTAVRGGSRVLGAAEAAVAKIAGGAVKADVKAALEEQAELLAIIEPVLAFCPTAFSSPEYLSLRKGSRVIKAATTAVMAIVTTCPPHDDWLKAREEHATIMDIVVPCLAMDPGSFATPDFLALRGGSRLIGAATKLVRAYAASPLVDDFAAMLASHKTMIEVVEACQALDKDHFAADEFQGLIAYGRIVEAMRSAVIRVASQPLPDDSFANAEGEYTKMMTSFVEPTVALVPDAFEGAEFAGVLARSRVVEAMEQAVKKEIAKPLLHDVAAAVAEHSAMVKAFVTPTQAVVPGAFTGEAWDGLLLGYSRIISGIEEAVDALAAQPLHETFAQGLAEYTNMMVTFVNPVKALNPLAFTAEKWAPLLNHSRIVDGMKKALRSVAANPIPESFDEALAEYESMMRSFVQPCLELVPDAFDGVEWQGLLGYSRLVTGCQSAVRKIASQKVPETFQLGFQEYQDMMSQFVNPCVKLVPDAFDGDEWKSLLSHSRLVAGGEQALRTACAATEPSLDSAEAMNEFSATITTLAPYLSLRPESFGADDLVAVRRGIRLEPCCEAAVAKDKLSNAAEYEALDAFMSRYAEFRETPASRKVFFTRKTSRVTLHHPAIGSWAQTTGLRGPRAPLRGPGRAACGSFTPPCRSSWPARSASLRAANPGTLPSSD